MKNRNFISPGFSALELVMVMAVSAIIMTSLFEIYNQVMRNANRVERFVTQDTQILTLENRLNKDIAGMSAIWFTQADLEKKRAAKDTPDSKVEKNQSLQHDQKKSSSYFYSINKNNNLEMLTFVTTSALQSYGATQDRFVRIVYKLEPDVRHQGNLRLMRKEIMAPSEYIDDDALKVSKFYELANNIASFETTYQFIDAEELKKQQKTKSEKDGASPSQSESKENKQLMRSCKEWKEEKKHQSAEALAKDGKKEKQQSQDQGALTQEDGQEDDRGGAVVPKIVEIKISFGLKDDPSKKEYKLAFYIPSTIDNVPKGIERPQTPAPSQEEGGKNL